jgi:hypothetical protein
VIKRIAENEIIPAWYGVAWHSDYERVKICMPMPANMIAAAIYRIYWWLRLGGYPVRSNPREAFAQGFRAGTTAMKMRKGLK